MANPDSPINDRINDAMDDAAHRIADNEAPPTADPATNDAATRYRAVDAAVRDAVTPPQMPAGLADLLTNGEAPAQAPSQATTGNRRLWLRAAAAVLLSGLAITLIAQQLPKARTIDAATVYATLTPAMQPQHICTTEDAFLDYSIQFLGAPIAADYNAGVEFVGWRTLTAGDYVAGVIGEGRILLARAADGTDAVLFMVRQGTHVNLELDRAAGLHSHETTLQGVRIVEVSQSPEPIALAALSLSN